ncbi:MAG: asparagine synthase (glutamine-hydrolyzing) [Planctomycetes bacterium]|nr:asparagine synthase (glutamine-hydrolyzing) [Planctomycetota bacterium]
MCGICGLINLDGSPADGELLATMARMMKHRGPDDLGVYTDGPAGIGMVRLSVIDLAGGHQPMHNEDESTWMVCNGEIYNFPELRKDLAKRGHQLYNRSDVETIVHLYEEHDAGFPNHLRGEFAVAVWDAPRRRMVLARDRLGVKPLHYYNDGKVFLFASEIKALLCHPAVKREVDPDAINEFLTWNYVPDPFTAFKGIRKLPPAHVLVFENGRERISQYWNISYDIDTKSSVEDLAEKVLAELSEAVKIRLISDVPLGAFLSGGVDSSAVVALMAQHSGRPVKTFSIGFEEADFNEVEYARIVAERFGTDHEEFIVKANAAEIIDDILWYLDEPFGDSSAIPTFVVSKIASSRVKVVLSGDGGDETFAGYERYQWEMGRRHFTRIPKFIRTGLFQPLSRLLPEAVYGKHFLNHISLEDDQRYVNLMSCFSNVVKSQLYTDDFRAKLSAVDCSESLMKHFRAHNDSDYLTRMMYVDAKTYLTGDCLVKTDRMSSANSLEVRVPFLDHKVTEIAATIPSDLKLRAGVSKYILKKCLRGLLPDVILDRGKMGFGVPVAKWFTGEWSQLLQQMLFEPRSVGRGYFNEKYIRHIWDEHKRGRRDHCDRLWALWVLESWHRKYIDADPAAGRG